MQHGDVKQVCLGWVLGAHSAQQELRQKVLVRGLRRRGGGAGRERWGGGEADRRHSNRWHGRQARHRGPLGPTHARRFRRAAATL